MTLTKKSHKKQANNQTKKKQENEKTTKVISVTRSR